MTLRVSASEAWRAAMCPGSVAAEAEKEDTPKLEKGREHHSLVASMIMKEQLDRPVEKEELEAAKQIVTAIERVIPPDMTGNIYVESSLSAKIRGVLWTGHPDLYIVSGDQAVIVDWKRGQLSHRFRDAAVWQMITYIALVTAHYKSQFVMAAVVSQRGVEVGYKMNNPAEAIERLKAISDAIKTKKLNAGDWCTLCPRSGKCKVEAEMIKAKSQVLKLDAKLTELSNDKLEELFLIADSLKSAFEAVRAEATRRLMAGETFNNIELAVRTRRTIKDGNMAFELLRRHLGLDPEAAIESIPITVSLDASARAVAKMKGTKVSQAKAEVNEVLSPVIEITQSNYAKRRDT